MDMVRAQCLAKSLLLVAGLAEELVGECSVPVENVGFEEVLTIAPERVVRRD